MIIGDRDLNVVGVMRLYDFVTPDKPWWLLPKVRLTTLCDKVVLVTTNPTPRMLAELPLLARLPKVEIVSAPQGKKWSQAGTLLDCIRIAETYDPDIVLMPDEDEVLPISLAHDIECWAKSHEVHPTMCFRFFQAWDSPDQIVAENVYRDWWHSKAVWWEGDKTIEAYEGKYAGWCWPSALYRRKKYRCHHPLLHLAYVTPELRAERTARHTSGRKTQKGNTAWWDSARLAMPYDRDMTWEKWVEQVGPYTAD